MRRETCFHATHAAPVNVKNITTTATTSGIAQELTNSFRLPLLSLSICIVAHQPWRLPTVPSRLLSNCYRQRVLSLTVHSQFVSWLTSRGDSRQSRLLSNCYRQRVLSLSLSLSLTFHIHQLDTPSPISSECCRNPPNRIGLSVAPRLISCLPIKPKAPTIALACTTPWATWKKQNKTKTKYIWLKYK